MFGVAQIWSKFGRGSLNPDTETFIEYLIAMCKMRSANLLFALSVFTAGLNDQLSARVEAGE